MENIVYITAPRDWFDYLATGATLLFSIVAAIIAVSTARRQNRIALFEKRDYTYRYIQNMVSGWLVLADSIKSSNDKIEISKFLSIYTAFHSEQNSIDIDENSTKLTLALLLRSICYRNLDELESIPRLFNVTSKTKEKIQKLLLSNHAIYVYLSAFILEDDLDPEGFRDNFTMVETTILENNDFIDRLESQILIGKL